MGSWESLEVSCIAVGVASLGLLTENGTYGVSARLKIVYG